ncbi:hypothetical protein [Fibrella aquatica]|uniref:hypothetical protein n=1 Tax=Fibrella aquatica TaxID=3242487 RepID=UPI003520EE9D
MESRQEEFLTLDLRKKDVHTGLRALVFPDGDHTIIYFPSLNLSAYGNDEREATDMARLVIADYFDNLLTLSEQRVIKELRQYGWVHKPFLTKQLRNSQFIDIETVKANFELPKETQVREQYMTA